MHFTLRGDELTRLQSLSLYLLLILTRKVKGSAVTVIWASPRFGHPLPKTLVIWASHPNSNRLKSLRYYEKGMPISLVFWEGDAQNAGVDAHITVTAR